LARVVHVEGRASDVCALGDALDGERLKAFAEQDLDEGRHQRRARTFGAAVGLSCGHDPRVLLEARRQTCAFAAPAPIPSRTFRGECPKTDASALKPGNASPELDRNAMLSRSGFDDD